MNWNRKNINTFHSIQFLKSFDIMEKHILDWNIATMILAITQYEFGECSKWKKL